MILVLQPMCGKVCHIFLLKLVFIAYLTYGENFTFFNTKYILFLYNILVINYLQILCLSSPKCKDIYMNF